MNAYVYMLILPIIIREDYNTLSAMVLGGRILITEKSFGGNLQNQ